jgi:LEA14-like dessication related protein
VIPVYIIAVVVIVCTVVSAGIRTIVVRLPEIEQIRICIGQIYSKAPGTSF